MSDILSDQIPSMAHILKCLDPHNASPLDCSDKLIEPKFLHEVEIAQGEEQNDWGKN